MAGRITLAGGWGYENLGDEAILAGYLEALSPHVDLVVTSRGPRRTAMAMRGSHKVWPEGAVQETDALLIGGGGYLNGGWMPEIVGKLGRLRRQARNVNVVAHAVEVRSMDAPLRRGAFKSVFTGAQASVRDEASRIEMAGLGMHDIDVVPDAISLLVPHLDAYRFPVADVSDKFLLNLLDIRNRSDSDQAEIDPMQWDNFVQELVGALGDKALGLVGGEGDREYITRVAPQLPLVEPLTVPHLVSLLGSVRGVLSVRMHPALLASALGTPVVSIPYCGKVRPTLTRIGVHPTIQSELQVDETLARWRSNADWTEPWRRASQASQTWLHAAVQEAAGA